MAQVSGLQRLVAACAVAAGVAACGAPAATPWTGDPIHLGSGDAVREGASGVAVGNPFGWAVEIRNESRSAAVVDGYELVGPTSGLRVLTAAGIETGSGLTGPVGLVTYGLTTTLATSAESALAGRKLVGWTVDPSAAPGSAIRQSLVFVLEAPRTGDYSVNSIVVTYHVGDRRYRSQIPASFDVCVGATTSDSATCPPAP